MNPADIIEQLLGFAERNEILARQDRAFVRNMLLSALRLPAASVDCMDSDASFPPTATPMLTELVEFAAQEGIIENMPFACEQFAAHLMNLVTPPPSQVISRFNALRETKSSRAATDWFYDFCRKNDYIRVDQIAKNIAFRKPSPYGELEITINLSKPEKDPDEIAREKNAPKSSYPKCMLCVENEGYTGRPGYPSHESMRIVPVALHGESWRFQYSPYSYYPEHCIVLNEKHIDMKISRRTFILLLDFVDQFPHYFIGSNADLPIVGGSILTHDHFQGGRHVFPMEKTQPYAEFSCKQMPDIRIEALHWPMTCLRLTGRDMTQLIDLADRILTEWRMYDDPNNDIVHQTDGRFHNTITPIVRKNEAGTYALHLVLRNNRTTDEQPLGLFHPHTDLHHIKRENIGLIEVMGLFILPGRLREELNLLTEYLTGAHAMQKPAESDPLAKHYDWIQKIQKAHPFPVSEKDALSILEDELALKCARVLEDSGVFKLTEAGKSGLRRFLEKAEIMAL